jgi:multicomponent K+:H+ antiporter subunit E
MRTLLPHPLASGSLLAVWLLLNNSLAPASALLGAVLAWLIPRLTERFQEDAPQLRRPLALVPLIAVFLWDVVAANVAVAKLVLGPVRRLHPRMLEIALEVRSAPAISALAGIVSLTPGTVSVDVSADRRTLLVHALNVADPVSAAARIKERYERRILQVFAC